MLSLLRPLWNDMVILDVKALVVSRIIKVPLLEIAVFPITIDERRKSREITKNPIQTKREKTFSLCSRGPPPPTRGLCTVTFNKYDWLWMANPFSKKRKLTDSKNGFIQCITCTRYNKWLWFLITKTRCVAKNLHSREWCFVFLLKEWLNMHLSKKKQLGVWSQNEAYYLYLKGLTKYVLRDVPKRQLTNSMCLLHA